MKAPKITKKDKRSHEEIKMDELISKMADEADDAKSASEVMDLMKKRRELENIKKPKIDPNLAINLTANTIWILSILHVENIKTVTSKAMGFVFKGRMR